MTPDTPGFHRVYSYVERGLYGAQLAHALTLFPRSQILALKSEDLDRDPTAVLARVAGHIGVAAPKAAVVPLRANVGTQTGGGLPDEDRTYLKALFSTDLKAFAQLSGLDIEAWAP